jgi:putative nucleotidyltransferase with HDIG domain
MELVGQQLFAANISEETYAHATTLIETGVKVLSTNDAGFLLLESVKEISDELYAHATAVSMISAMIAKAIGWNSTHTLMKVAMAGMLHDIGKKQIAREIAVMPRARMGAAELAIYESHPRRGLEILSEEDFLPSDVIQIVYQHHERGNGSGFPQHLNEGKIFPLAKVVAVADEFCNIYLNSADRESGDPKRAIHKLMEFHSDGLGVEALIALHGVFGLKLPEMLAKKQQQQKNSPPGIGA